MHRSIFFLLAILTILFSGCGEVGTTIPASEHVSDTAKAPNSGNQPETRPWDANKNLINPNGFDGIADPLDEILMPFNAGYMRSKGFSRIEIRSYADSENPNMVEDAPETDMKISRRRLFTFDDLGQLKDVLDEKFLGDATPVTSTHLAWTYSAPDKATAIDVEEKLGNAKSSYRRTYSFDAKDRLSTVQIPKVSTTYYMYDDEKARTYLTIVDQKSVIKVTVIGAKGTLGTEVCNDLQDEINMVASPFVHYPLKSSVPTSITFQERDGRETVRELRMGIKEGKIESTIDRQYNADHNITERKNQWDVPNADFKTLTKFRYSPIGDLIEVFHQKQTFNKPIINEIDRYEYHELGLLQNRVRTSRIGQDAEELVLLEFFTFTKASPAAKASDAQPSGTR
jgi:hypothetical protein